jgi:hypothetical protein
MSVAWLLLGSSPALALRLRETPEALHSRADLIARVEVLYAEARWAPGDRGGIETAVELAVLEVLGGEGPELLEVVLPGGTLDGLTMGVSGAPSLPVGAVCEVSLGRIAGAWRVLGGEAGVSCQGAAPPYNLTGYSWSYESDPVETPFYLNAEEFPGDFGGADNVEETILAAMGAWNTEAGAAVGLRLGGRTDRDSTRSDGTFTIHYDSTYYYDTGTLAVSTYWGSGGRLSECDVAFYGANLGGGIRWSANPDGAGRGEMDFQYVATHELGHCLGLSHSSSSAAVMYPSAPSGAGPSQRALDGDDIAGLQAIYGAAAPSVYLHSYTLFDDGDPSPGEEVELLVTVGNSGSGRAYEVGGTVSGGGDVLALEAAEALAELGPGETQDLTFAGEVGAGCEGEIALSLSLTLSDGSGWSWTEPLEVALGCAEAVQDDDDDVHTASDTGDASTFPARPSLPPRPGDELQGCATAGAAGGWLWVFGLLAMRRRTRE